MRKTPDFNSRRVCLLAPTFGCSKWALSKTCSTALLIRIPLFEMRSCLSVTAKFEIQKLGKMERTSNRQQKADDSMRCKGDHFKEKNVNEK